jgi:hypothetical protein
MHSYYEQKKSAIMSQIDGFIQAGQKVLSRHYDIDLTNAELKATRDNYAIILDKLPYIGGDANRLTFTLIWTAMALALYQATKAHGGKAHDAAKMFYEILEFAYSNRFIKFHITNRDPKVVAKAIEQEKDFDSMLQRREYPENWVAKYIDCTGTEFDYGRDFEECGMVKLLRTHGAGELGPYLCTADFLQFKAQRMGFKRTKTLALGDSCCDFRIRLGSDKISLEPFSEALLKEWGKLT